MERSYANVHRGVYAIAEETTARFEAARLAVAAVHRRRRHRRARLHPQRHRGHQPRRVLVGAAPTSSAGDVIVLSEMEHHANIIPWHMLAAERGVELRWIPLTADYRLDLTDLDALLAGAKLLAITRDVERARHGQRHPAARRAAATCRGRARPRRRVPGRAAPRDRRAGVGCRLRRDHRAQDARTVRHRRAVGSARAARGDAAVPRRRRDDPRRPQGRLHHQRAARGSSRPARRAITEAIGWARRSST